MNENTFVIWSNSQRGYVESIGRGGVFYTDDLDNAFQFAKKRAAEDALEACDAEHCVILKWL